MKNFIIVAIVIILVVLGVVWMKSNNDAGMTDTATTTDDAATSTETSSTSTDTTL
jgi:hypothetical protein